MGVLSDFKKYSFNPAVSFVKQIGTNLFVRDENAGPRRSGRPRNAGASTVSNFSPPNVNEEISTGDSGANIINVGGANVGATGDNNTENFNDTGTGFTNKAYTSPQRKNFDYRSLLVPGREGRNNYYLLSDYYWYPENLTRFYHEDLFKTADEQFDLTDEPGITQGFIGTIINDVRNEINSAVKFVGDVKDQVNSIRDKFNNIFNPDKNSKRGGEDSNDDKLELRKERVKIFDDIPHANVTEIQPLQSLEFVIDIFSQIADLSKFWFEGKGDFKRIKASINSFASGMPDQKGAIVGFLENVTDAEKAVLAIPNFMYSQLIGGTVRGKYRIPFSPQETYWNARGSSGWESRTLAQQFVGGTVSNFIKKIPGAGQFDIAGRPRFISPNETHDEFTSTFHLFNYNDTAIKANMKFIHSFISGAWWTQIGIIQTSSNLYDVEVPGRFRYLFCSADVKIEQVGKIRRLPTKIINDLRSTISKSPQGYESGAIVDRRSYRNKGYNLNEAYISMVPDTYRVTVTYKSLLPNNLNTYLAYAITDHDNAVDSLYSTYDIGQNLESGLDSVLQNIFQQAQGDLPGDFSAFNLGNFGNVIENAFDSQNLVKAYLPDFNKSNLAGSLVSNGIGKYFDKNKVNNSAVDKVTNLFD
jgi:hypothetical protein